MSKKLLKKFKDQKIGDVRRELARAHLIIAILSFVIIVLLIEAAYLVEELHTSLTALAIALLAILSLISLIISLTMSSLNKK